MGGLKLCPNIDTLANIVLRCVVATTTKTRSKFAPKDPTNASVARALGISNAHVSRMRRGEANPSGILLRRIERVFDWAAIEQWQAIRDGNYGEHFERVISEA